MPLILGEQVSFVEYKEHGAFGMLCLLENLAEKPPFALGGFSAQSGDDHRSMVGDCTAVGFRYSGS